MDGKFKKTFKFDEQNFTSLHPVVLFVNDGIGRQQNISYTKKLYGFKKSTSRAYFDQPYTFGYEGCCWSTIIPTYQQLTSSMDFMVVATVFEVTNIAPRITLPSMWYINKDCDSSLELHPFDIDQNDVIKCRWADENEAGFAATSAIYRSFVKLNDTLCKLEFDQKEFRKFSEENNWSNSNIAIPIAIMIEDYKNGNERSSMPAQFLVGNMLTDDTSGDSDVSTETDETDVNTNNGDDAEDYSTIGTTETANCDLIPVLSAVKDLVHMSENAPEIKRSFNVYKNGRNGNHSQFKKVMTVWILSFKGFFP